MNFYDFELPFNRWFEKELYFKKININEKKILELYEDFLTSLSKDSEYIINKNDRFNLKIVFSNVNLNDQIYMCNNWTSYNSLTDRYIRKAELYLINDNFNKILIINWLFYQ